MDLEDHYCVRWKGFHSNIVNALEDLKSDEAFVDVTLSCSGETIQGHKVILSACSPYFKKILKDNPCRHPVLILNDIELEVLDALMTYMYHGTVSVPHNKLQLFLKTAEALKIKGIVDTTCDSSSDSSSLVSPPHQVQEQLLTIPQPPPLLPTVHSAVHHPAGDLSLLASAASEQASAQLESSGPPQPNNKRRKTAPRKLGSYLINNSSHLNRAQHSPGHRSDEEQGDTEKENNRLISQLINKDRDRETLAGPGLLKEGMLLTNGKVSAINLTVAGATNAQNSAGMKEDKLDDDTSLDLTVKSLMSQDPSTSPPPPNSSSQFQLLTASILPTSSGPPINLLAAEGATAADQMAALLGPDQMAALLGPSWKSRQPRMCQYCQRMFSNKFNLKQHILNMHTVGKELQCEICQKKVKNKWYLRRHHVTHHGAPLKK